MKKNIKNPVCIIKWQDAAYSFDGELEDFPRPTITVGFIAKATDEYVHIMCSADYNEKTKKLTPRDGLLVPSSAIIEFRKIGYLNEEKK